MTFTRMASQRITTFTFGVVLTWVMALTLFKDKLTIGGLWSTAAHTNHRSLNLEPLYSWYHATVWYGPWMNTFGNILLFVPLTFLITGLLRRHVDHPALLAAAIGVALSFSIEVAQFVFAVGYSDIDDLIFNSLGGAIGAFAFTRMGARHRGMFVTVSLIGSLATLALMAASSSL